MNSTVYYAVCCGLELNSGPWVLPCSLHIEVHLFDFLHLLSGSLPNRRTYPVCVCVCTETERYCQHLWFKPSGNCIAKMSESERCINISNSKIWFRCLEWLRATAAHNELTNLGASPSLVESHAVTQSVQALLGGNAFRGQGLERRDGMFVLRALD